MARNISRLMQPHSDIEKRKMTKRLRKVLSVLENELNTREQVAGIIEIKAQITETKQLILKRQSNGECYKIL